MTRSDPPASDKVNVGSGTDIQPGWVNLDVAPLPGVDVVHDLTELPWPFPDDQFSEIKMIHVLEHLPDTVKTMEELHRIAKPGARVTIRVPYYNAPSMYTDPTHRAFFSERTFDFFDPKRPHCGKRPYYSTARFSIERMSFYLRVFKVYIRVGHPLVNPILTFFANRIGAIIWSEEVELKAIK
ncbi:MAG: methyltransferase domain-containing protein [Luteitalea sp.]|nr:methyltransferase domain-containing protein [Luteitalea sp.]